MLPTLLRLNTSIVYTEIKNALASVADNKTEAASILGIDRRTLYRKLEEPES